MVKKVDLGRLEGEDLDEQVGDLLAHADVIIHGTLRTAGRKMSVWIDEAPQMGNLEELIDSME